MKFHESVRVPMVSDRVKCAIQISKDKALMPLLTGTLLFIFVHLSCVHLTTLKIHNISQTPLNFKQKTSPEVVTVNNGGNSTTNLMRIPFLVA